MTETITATENTTTETNKGKRGRKAYTFHDLVSMEPNEVAHAWQITCPACLASRQTLSCSN